MRKIKCYHGTTAFIENFNLDFLENGEHQDGIGIYFALDKKNTEYYSGKNGNVYEVELNPKKLLKQKSIISEDIIINLIKTSPNYNDFIGDFIDLESKKLTKEQICKIIAKFYLDMNPKEFFRSFSGDIYSKNTKSFIENFHKFSGYDMMSIDLGNNITNVVVFNPKIIEIKKNLNLKAQKEYDNKKEKELIKYNNITNFLNSYKNKNELLEDVIFHGTNFLKITKNNIKTGRDNLFWTANNPQIAQNYVSKFTHYILKSEITFDERINQNFKKLYPLNSTNVEKLKFLGYEIRGIENLYGGYDSYELFKNNIKINEIPNENVFNLFMRENGYFPDKDNNFNIKFKFDIKNDNKLLINNNEIENGKLVILKGIKKLKILDVSNDEGDLNIKQYTNYELFKKLNDLGYDGIKINDFTNSDYWGHYEHNSIGLTKEALKKLEILVVDCKRFEWNDKKIDKYQTNDFDFNKVFDNLFKNNLNTTNNKELSLSC